MKPLAAAALFAVTFATTFFAAAPAFAQYNKVAGQNAAPAVSVRVERRAADGSVGWIDERRPAAADKFGNAAGSHNDLAVDGAFDGQTVAVLHLYTAESFDFALPKKALAEKGFSVYRWVNQPPAPAELREKLKKACQLWIISDSTQKLNAEHLQVIREFFDSGKGVYIWGDNEPYYADANQVARALLDADMTGNLMGDKVVGLSNGEGKPGVRRHHLLTTGLENLYEGITIATLNVNANFTPIVWGSAGNLVTAVYEKGGKRAILDGGFTRLYNKWDTAGTGRYVKNAAAWLANVERFGDGVVAETFKKAPSGPRSLPR